MRHQSTASASTANWGWPLRGLVLLALLLPAIGTVPVTEAAPRVQPQLLAMAAQHPDKRVSVIVQKQVKDSSVEELVSRLGGTVTKDLRIINAFAAEMQAKDVPQLAKADGVRWVSMDAPVTQSSGPNQFTTWATDLGTAATSSL